MQREKLTITNTIKQKLKKKTNENSINIIACDFYAAN